MGLAVSLLPCCTPGCGVSSGQMEMMHRAAARAQQQAVQGHSLEL